MSKHDLDAMTPEPVIVIYNGQEITIKPPKLKDVLLLSKYGGRLENLTELDDKVIEETAEQLEAILKRLIPEIADANLSLTHVLELPLLILEATSPKEKTEDGRVVTQDPKAE